MMDEGVPEQVVSRRPIAASATGHLTDLTIRAALPVILTGLLLAAAAGAYQPLPWDVLVGEETGQGYVRLPPRMGRARGYGDISGPTAGPRELFGTAGAFFDYHVALDGHIPGVSDGRGYTIEIPATLPAWFVYALIANPMAVLSTLSPEAWTSGLRGEGLRSSPVFDEINFELLYSRSSHDDEIYGGGLDYTRVGLGVRLSGPAPADRLLRGSLTLGWTWHALNFDRRDDYIAAGLYVGLGLETRFVKESDRRSRYGGDDSMVSVHLSARWDFVRGPDNVGDDFDVTLFTAGAGISFYW